MMHPGLVRVGIVRRYTSTAFHNSWADYTFVQYVYLLMPIIYMVGQAWEVLPTLAGNGLHRANRDLSTYNWPVCPSHSQI